MVCDCLNVMYQSQICGGEDERRHGAETSSVHAAHPFFYVAAPAKRRLTVARFTTVSEVEREIRFNHAVSQSLCRPQGVITSESVTVQPHRAGQEDVMGSDIWRSFSTST